LKTTESTGLKSRKLGEFFRLKHGYAFKGEFFADCGPFVVLTPGNFFDEGGFKHKAQEKYYVGEVPDGYILRKAPAADCAGRGRSSEQ